MIELRGTNQLNTNLVVVVVCVGLVADGGQNAEHLNFVSHFDF